MASPDAIGHAAKMLANGKKTGLVLGNLALRGDPLEIAGRIAAKTNAALLSETFPSLARAGRGTSNRRDNPLFSRNRIGVSKGFRAIDLRRRPLPRCDIRLQEQAGL